MRRHALYRRFMGASSRFAAAAAPADFAALAREPLGHCPPARPADRCAIGLVKLLRWCADKVFRERFLHRATMLKAMAPAPPCAGAAAAFLRMMFTRKGKAALREEENNGFAMEVRGFMAQAESHACHAHFLMCMTEITYLERSVALLLQISHFTVFLLLFLLWPRMALRLMGYLAEESVVVWTHMVNDIDLGKVADRKVPQQALIYWGLRGLQTSKEDDSFSNDKMPTDVSHAADENINKEKEEERQVDVITLREVVLLIRSDEMVWRDACHKMANDIDQDRLKKKTKTF